MELIFRGSCSIMKFGCKRYWIKEDVPGYLIWEDLAVESCKIGVKNRGSIEQKRFPGIEK